MDYKILANCLVNMVSNKKYQIYSKLGIYSIDKQELFYKSFLQLCKQVLPKNYCLHTEATCKIQTEEKKKRRK